MGTLRKALGVALVGHVLVALAFSRVPLPVPAPPTLIGDRTIALDDEPAPSGNDQPVVTPGPAATPERRVAVVAAAAARGASREVGGVGEDGRNGAAGPGTLPPIIVHREGSGIGLYKGLLESFTRTTIGPPVPPEFHQAERSVREALAERDRLIGIGRSGPLVTAAHAAASGPYAPQRGTTTIEVDCDATGTVTATRADNGLWDGVAERIVTEMKGKSVRVREGTGLRSRLRVVAELARASGERGTVTPGAVADDVPGGTTKVCVGEGLERKCLAGMPVGFTYSKKDLSNVGDEPKRVVHVDILSEAELR